MTEAIHRPTYGDDAMRDSREAAIRSARLTQRVAIAVAPGVRLDVVRAGEAIVLQPGAELMLSDFVAGNPVAACLQSLIDREAVVRLSDAERSANCTPTSARYVVARGGGVSTTHGGIIPGGGAIKADDFVGGQADLDDLVSRGAIVDRKADK